MRSILGLVCLCVICRSVPDSYADQLVEEGLLERDEITKTTADHMAFLAEQLKLVDSTIPKVLRFFALFILQIYIASLVKLPIG